MEWAPMGELMTEKGGARPFMEELRVLMGECSDGPDGPMAGGLSSDGCMPWWDVGEPRGDGVSWPEESVGAPGGEQSGWK